MKILSFLSWSFIISVAMLSMFSCSSAEDKLVEQTLEDFFYDVAHKTPERFHMATKEELEALGVKEDTFSEGHISYSILTMEKQKVEERWKLILEKVNEILEDKGVDWKNYSIHTNYVGKAYVLENIDGVESFGPIGTVDIISNDKKVTVGFLFTVANGKAIFMNQIDGHILNLLESERYRTGLGRRTLILSD